MYCISISYKTADINLRQKLAFSQSDCSKISSELIDDGGVSQCVMLCTCNRTEVYFCGTKDSVNKVIQTISNNAGVEKSLLLKHLLFYYGDNAIIHLFKVTSGIESMVIGEDEILGQAKVAYMLAKENGTVSYELNMVFQAAFACAKKIKTETVLSKTSVSVATLAANEVAKLSEKVKVLVIGASGKTGSTVLKNLVSHKNVSTTATLRHHNSHMEFIKNMGIEIVDYNKRYDYIKDADCIISATSSPHYTITYYDLKKHLLDNRKRLFIDLAVPPDIDNSITQLSGASIVNIDYFEKLAQDNNSLKIDSVEVAKEMISKEVDTLKKDLIFHEFLPLLGSVKENLSDKPVEKFIYKMKSKSTAEEFSAFLNVLKTFKIQV